MTHARTITAQRDSGLLTTSEARDMLARLVKQAEFNRDYSDHVDSYNRWHNESLEAARALHAS